MVDFITPVQKFGACLPPPKKIAGQKHAKFGPISDPFSLWAQISLKWIEISKIRKLGDRQHFMPRSTKKVWWTLVHWC